MRGAAGSDAILDPRGLCKRSVKLSLSEGRAAGRLLHTFQTSENLQEQCKEFPQILHPVFPHVNVLPLLPHHFFYVCVSIKNINICVCIYLHIRHEPLYA